jgi:hypothetical protein
LVWEKDIDLYFIIIMLIFKLNFNPKHITSHLGLSGGVRLSYVLFYQEQDDGCNRIASVTVL